MHQFRFRQTRSGTSFARARITTYQHHGQLLFGGDPGCTTFHVDADRSQGLKQLSYFTLAVVVSHKSSRLSVVTASTRALCHADPRMLHARKMRRFSKLYVRGAPFM